MRNKKQSSESQTQRRYSGISNLTPSLYDSTNQKQSNEADNIQKICFGSGFSNSGENLKNRSTLKVQIPYEDQFMEPLQNNSNNISKQSSRQSHRKSSTISNCNVKLQLNQSQVKFKNKFKEYRINRLVKHFVDKLKRVSIHQNPVTYEPFNQKVQDSQSFSGIQIHRYLFYLYLFCSILAIFSNAFLSTFIIAFPQSIIKDSINSFNIFSLLWIVFQIFLGFILEKQKGPKKLKAIKEIALEYVKTQFIIDLMFLIAIFTRLDFDFDKFFILQFLIFLKITDGIKKLRILEIKIMQFSYQEHFWGLFKMVLTNFLLIHIIAICLLLMSRLEPDQNWMIQKKIQNTEWWEQYGWAYYWAATTMLTVGFGDIIPANLKEALSLVFIEVFSCMTLAYNINLIGKILDEMQKGHIQKHKNLKILHQICDQNQLESDLQFKLVNHVKQTHKIQTKFNLQEQNKFINKLPSNLKLDYLRQSNTKILARIQFFKNFTHKTIWRIAEKLNQKMSHPWEIVIDNTSKDIIILREGKVGLFPNIKRNQHVVIDFFQSKGNQSTLIQMSFARRKFIIRNYILKSIGYSIIKWVNNHEFLEILKQRAQDFEYYCSFLDKERRDLEEDFQLIQCKQCNKFHSKFSCPRLHYSPIQQKIVYSYLYLLKQSKTSRKSSFKRKKMFFNSLILYKTAFQNPTFEQFRTSQQLELCDQFTLSKKNSKHNKSQEVKGLDLNVPQFKILKQSIKNQLFGAFDFRKNIQQHFWLVQSDKAYDFQFYFPNSNPKQIEVLNTKKMQVRKSNSISRSKSIARKVIS